MSPPSRTSDARRPRTELPPYEPMLHPITARQARQLDTLHQSHSFAKLKKHLQSANDAITLMAGDVNDRAMRMQETQKRRKARRAREGRMDDPDEEQREQRLADYLDAAREMTDKMEVVTRELIDSTEQVKATENALKTIPLNIRAARPVGSQAPSSERLPRRRRAMDSDDPDSEDDEIFQDEPVDTPIPDDRPAPLKLLQRELQQHKTQYESQSLRTRYANHNNYVHFKRIVHDAQNPGEGAPPLPNPSTWFPSEEKAAGGPSLRRTRGAHDDDDIEIAREVVSLKCPLTLLPFKDPVTSKKCPHSFERNAIMPMIQQSEARIGGLRRGEGIRAVKCPICDQMLSADDLYTDKVLLRRIKRYEGREDDSDNEDSTLPRGTQATAVDDDSDQDIDVFGSGERAAAARRSLAPQIKAEKARASRPPAAPPGPPQASQVVDLGDGSDEEDDE